MADTRQAVADALEALSENLPLDRITVRDLTSRCGIARQTFYYYFHDIYDVVEWFFRQAVETALGECHGMEDWPTGYLLLLRFMQQHKTLVTNIYRSVRREYVDYFMNQMLLRYVQPLATQTAEGMNVTQEQAEFVARFYTLALNNISLDWIRNGMKESPAALADKASTLLRGTFQKSLSNFQQQNAGKTYTLRKM